MIAEWGRFNQVHHDEQRTLTKEERVRWLAGQLDCELDEAKVPALLEALEESLFVTRPDAVEGMPELVRALSEHYVLAIISDTSYSGGRTLRKLLVDFGILDQFAVTTFSDEMGRAKPHPDLFERTLKQAGFAPEEAIHIGDREDTDVRGAKAAGLDAILFLAASKKKDASGTEADFVARTVMDLAEFFRVR